MPLIAQTDARQWYYTRGGQQEGPIAEAALRQWLAAGRVAQSDMVWTTGMAQWLAAGAVPELGASVPTYPPQGASPPPLGAVPIPYASPRPIAPGSDIGQNAGMRWLLPVGRSGWAIAAGYLGLLSFIIFPAPLALICAILALREMKQHPERHGMGRAIFGLVMGILGTLALMGFFLSYSASRH